MAKTKSTKISKISAKKKAAKKPTTKVNSPPESVQWVLDFLNLRSEPGKQNLNKLPADVRKELKCPPLHPSLDIEQCSPTLEDFKQFFLKEGILPKKGTELFLENGKTLESLDTKVDYPETWYTPTYNDYPFERKLYIKIHEELWGELCKILGNMIHGTKTYDNEGTAEESFNHFKQNILGKYIDCLKDDEIPYEGGYSKNRGADFRGIIDVVKGGVSEIDSFPHYGMLPQAIYSCILDFCNHKGILLRLKQCPYCGKFEIEKVTKGVRGRKRIHCSDECREKFGQPDKEANKVSQASSRKWKRQAAKKEIVDWLCSLKDSPYSKKEAEEIYENESKLHPNNVASLKAFQKTYGRRTYLI